MPGAQPPDGRQLAAELARVSSERDALLHLLLRDNATLLGRAARRWSDFTARHGWAQRWISRPSRLLWLLLTLRWPAGIRVNPLFDEGWYREQYPDAPAGRRAAYRQYLRLARSKGRDPNAHFDTDWYVEHNPDVAAGHWQPLDHYLFFGWREMRDPERRLRRLRLPAAPSRRRDHGPEPAAAQSASEAPGPGDPVDPFDLGGRAAAGSATAAPASR